MKIESIVFFLETDCSNELEHFSKTISSLQAAHDWKVEPPSEEVLYDDDVPIGVCCLLRLRRTETLFDVDVEQQALNEIKLIVSAMRRFTEEHETEVGIMYHEEDIGWIDNGRVGKSIQVGLLDEWQNALEWVRSGKKLEDYLLRPSEK